MFVVLHYQLFERPGIKILRFLEQRLILFLLTWNYWSKFIFLARCYKLKVWLFAVFFEWLIFAFLISYCWRWHLPDWLVNPEFHCTYYTSCTCFNKRFHFINSSAFQRGVTLIIWIINIIIIIVIVQVLFFFVNFRCFVHKYANIGKWKSGNCPFILLYTAIFDCLKSLTLTFSSISFLFSYNECKQLCGVLRKVPRLNWWFAHILFSSTSSTLPRELINYFSVTTSFPKFKYFSKPDSTNKPLTLVLEKIPHSFEWNTQFSYF